MRQLQVTVPEDFREEVEEILEGYSSDVSSGEVERNNEKAVEFTVSADSEDIDELSEELKGIDEMDSGELSIRVLQQESLIEKGQQTRGSSSTLSQEEIYSKAQESSSFSKAEWGLVAVASAIAAYGLALDNVIVVIGAMMLAPLLSPFISGAISLVVGDRSLIQESLVSGGMSILVVIAVSFTAVLPFPLQLNPTLELVTSSGIITILLSLFVGAAAALSFSTGMREQIAGVAVAIALVPPLAAVGIGLKMQDIVFAAHAASIAGINILAVISSGFVTFKTLGLKPSTYYKQKQAEKMRFVVPGALLLLGIIAAPVVYSSYQSYQDYTAQQEIRDRANEFFGDDLLEVKFQDSTVTVTVVGDYDESAFRDSLEPGYTVKVRELAPAG